MSLLTENDIDYPCTVTVTRPQGSYDEDGNYQESPLTVIDGMSADIQLSLRIRKLSTENGTGTSDNTVWAMFCVPPAEIRAGDSVSDGSRNFIVEGVGDWGTHCECVMSICN